MHPEAGLQLTDCCRGVQEPTDTRTGASGAQSLWMEEAGPCVAASDGSLQVQSPSPGLWASPGSAGCWVGCRAVPRGRGLCTAPVWRQPPSSGPPAAISPAA